MTCYVTDRVRVEAINRLSHDDFRDRFATVVEHSPWVAEALARQRPFADVQALVDALERIVSRADPLRQRELLCLHPELSGKEAEAGALTEHSSLEQSGLGLDQLPAGELAMIRTLNRRYRQKFGFPFVVCVRRLSDRAQLYAIWQARLDNDDADAELARGIAEVNAIARLRLEHCLATVTLD